MKKYFEILRKCCLFDNITEGDLSTVLGCLGARVARYGKRETVVAEGEPARDIGLLLSGGVQVEQVDYFGNRSILSTVEPGELFLESFACAGVGAIPVQIVASVACEVMFIDCMRVMHACCRACAFHQQMIYNLIKDVAGKNIHFHQKMEITSKRSTREKLMAYLLWQAKKNDSRRFEIPYGRQELADYLEVDRSGLSAEIGKLRREGVLRSERRFFELL